MGKYLPIITTARCGSLNKAAGQLGYSHPSLWYIINNLEDDLGVKLFHRSKRGVTLTEAGAELLDLMVEIEEREERLYKIAHTFRENCLTLGVLPSISSQWLPDLLTEMTRKHPNVQMKLETPTFYRDGAEAVANHTLTCCFSTLANPPGVDCIPLYDDPYLVVVGLTHELADRDQVSLEELVSQYPLIPSSESLDPDSALWSVYQAAESLVSADGGTLEPRLPVALAGKDLGAAILPSLALGELYREYPVRVLPLADGMHRTITLLCQKKNRRTALDNEFIKLVTRFVETWRKGREPTDSGKNVKNPPISLDTGENL